MGWGDDFTDEEIKRVIEALNKYNTKDYHKYVRGEWGGTVALKVKLITADSLESEIAYDSADGKYPKYIERNVGPVSRKYELDKYRDGEYREVKSRNYSKSNKPYTVLLNDFGIGMSEMGEKAHITVHVDPNTFKRMYKEFSGKTPDASVTFMQLNTPGNTIFVRFAPEKTEVEKKSLVLADDLKKLTLKELVDSKLAQEK